MITVYGADWCEDTRRATRHLRRLGVAHHYINIDEDADALRTAKALNGGERRTPVIDLDVGGNPLIEPSNSVLTEALVELEMLTQEDVQERVAIQNVGDAERALRTGTGAALWLASGVAPRPLRRPLRVAAAFAAATGVLGWCPFYHSAGVTSLDGPADHPDEATRDRWLASRRQPAAETDPQPDVRAGVSSESPR